MTSRKSTLVLPKEPKGEILITPKLSEETNTHIYHLEPMVKKLAKELDTDLYLTMSVRNEGVLVSWGPVAELNLEEMEKVEEESQELHTL